MTTVATSREQRIHDVLENVDWLLKFQESPHHISKRVGLTAGTLARYAYEAHRPDLVEVFGALRDRDAQRGRTNICVDCGGSCSHSATRCQTCSVRIPRKKRRVNRKFVRRDFT
jgi:hypothetical protein